MNTTKQKGKQMAYIFFFIDKSVKFYKKFPMTLADKENDQLKYFMSIWDSIM